MSENWKQAYSRDHDQIFYYNPTTGKQTIEMPPNFEGPYVIKASHLLVKHNESRRPSSWREAQITRSKEDAFKQIEDFRKILVKNESSFSELASKYSDCSSASRGGDLGYFGHGEMQQVFYDAASKLEVGELSQPVQSDSGIHLILRTA